MGIKYLFTVHDNNTFGFKDDSINNILSGDIKITDDIYTHFFELQSQGKQFKIKDMNGTSFDDIFEEYTPEPVPHVPTETEILQQQVADLTYQLMQNNVL